MQRLGCRAGWKLYRDLVIAGNATAFRTDERAAIEATRMRQDADVLKADFQYHLRCPRARREMEIRDAGVAGEIAIEQQVGCKRWIEDPRSVRELQIFIDIRLDGGAAREVVRRAVDLQCAHCTARRQNDRRIELERQCGER